MTRPVLELRTFPRASVDVSGTIQRADGTAVPVEVRNLSEGGMLVHARSSIPEGEAVSVSLVPSTGDQVTVRGRVVRATLQGDDMSVLGIAWDQIEDGVRERLRELVVASDAMAWGPVGGALPDDVARKFVPRIRAHAWVITRRSRLDAHLGLDDLVGAGFVALVETFARSGTLPPEEFERLVDARIRGAMLDEIRRADHVPRSTRRAARELRAKRKKLEANLNRPPTHAELADEAKLPMRAYDELASVLTPMPQMYVRPNMDEEPRGPDPTPEEAAQAQERLALARRAFEALPDRLRQVLTLYYGDEMTLREIGNLLGVSEGRISQLLSGALEKLKGG